MSNEDPSPSERPQHDPEAKSKQALRDLERLQNTSEVVGTSAFARAANKARDHMSATDKDADDPVEVWATRVARALAVLAFAYLVYFLLTLGL